MLIKILNGYFLLQVLSDLCAFLLMQEEAFSLKIQL